MGRSGNSKKQLLSSAKSKTRASQENASRSSSEQFLSLEDTAQKKAASMSIAELEAEVLGIYNEMRHHRLEGYHKSNTQEAEYSRKVVLSYLTGGISNEYDQQIERMTMVKAALEELIAREDELKKYNKKKFGGDEWDSRTEVTAQGCQEIIDFINPTYQEAKNNAAAVDYQDVEDNQKRQHSIFSQLWRGARNW